MKKPKILHLITSLNIGGTEQFLLNIVNNLKSKYDFTVGYLKKIGEIAKEIDAGIPIYKFDYFLLKKYLKEKKYDIIHTHLFRANILGRIAGKSAGTPIIISSQRSIDGWKKFYHVFLDKMTSRYCNLVIANSEYAKNILITREHIPERIIKVIYNGISTYNISGAKFPPFNKNKPVIGYVGRLHNEKGVYLIPEIVKIVIEKNPNIKFLIIGNGPEMYNMKLNVYKYKLKDSVEFLGWERNLKDIYYKINILLLPSEEESFPQAALEAMSFGIPVIASDVGGVSELVEDKKTGILVKDRTAGEFADAIMSIIDNQYDYNCFSENSKAKSSEFSVEKMVSSIDKIYKDCLSTIVKI
ncbi:MAG: hypothetical protein A2474_03505 [Elusimicrobia bacterium RIFOXYC2_FULL_34_12]|nr:MAG: hypothetical protein A2474_03505 [Elusimicrobia bacterium RIFOXYC2_FULL_34_12]HAM38236.1 hypothetical protein [Elusimicrobiota bacterium]